MSKKSKSCTRKVQASASFEMDCRIVELVDTPGFNNDEMTDTQVLGMIGEWMKER